MFCKWYCYCRKILLSCIVLISYCTDIWSYHLYKISTNLKQLPRNEKAPSMTQVPWNKNYRRSPFWLGRSSINGHQWPQFSVPGTNQRRSEDWNTTNLCSLQTHIHIYEHIYIYIYTHTRLKVLRIYSYGIYIYMYT